MAQLRCTNVAFCCNGCTTFSVDGANGRLLEVTDDLSCSLFSANTIAGLPVVEAFANYCVVMGQYGGHQLQVTCTSIRGGKCTTASGTYSFVGGGVCSLASGKASVIVGGCCNTASGCFSFIGGGGYDDNTAPPATGNTASGCHSVVVGGDGNIVAVGCASVVGGRKNCVCGQQSFIGGGICNLICGGNSALVGGAFNCVTGQIAAVVGGICNTASGYMSFVGGGRGNIASGNCSAVLGGCGNTASASYAGAFGCNLSANASCTFFTNNQCTCGNINASGNITASGNIGASNLSSGTHSPVAVTTSNVSSFTNYTNTFMRVGSVVTVSGRIDITPSGTGNATVGITLPIASNFTADTDLSGTITSLGQRLGIIIANTTNDVAQITVFAAGGASVTYTFVYQYRIL